MSRLLIISFLVLITNMAHSKAATCGERNGATCVNFMNYTGSSLKATLHGNKLDPISRCTINSIPHNYHIGLWAPDDSGCGKTGKGQTFDVIKISGGGISGKIPVTAFINAVGNITVQLSPNKAFFCYSTAGNAQLRDPGKVQTMFSLTHEESLKGCEAYGSGWIKAQ